MSIIPNTTCRRCHRQYPSIRNRCPYCGTKRVKEVHKPVPDSDSAVHGTPAAKRSSQQMSTQLLVGGVILVVMLVFMIVIISVNVRQHVNATDLELQQQQEQAEEAAAATAVPTSTPEPTPSPTPAPEISSVNITFLGADEEGFMEKVGTKVDLDVSWYPATIGEDEVTIEWWSSDESVATVDEDGVVTLVGAGNCVVYVSVNDVTQSCDVWSY